MDETLLQFEPDHGVTEAQASAKRLRTVCPACGQRFPGDARFCAFDGEVLAPASDFNPGADPLLGTVIDKRYEIIEVLGEGGMGTVYRARHATLGRSFALKALRRDLAMDTELSERFIQEAKAAGAICHPNVVEITDFGELPNGQPYFVMELLKGVPLSWLIRKGGPIPAGRAVRILRQVAQALAAAHQAGVIHRDLKPDNIHIAGAAGEQDVVKVLDFGLAKVIGHSRLTREGMVFGTPHYMSPEQAAGENVDHRADVYSLGVVMYEMFTGRVPFEADSYMGVLTKHIYVQPTPLSEVVGSRELGALEDITLRCLQKKPAHRYASMTALLEELDAIVRYTESGELDVRPTRTGGLPSVRSVLADELEALSPEELNLALARSTAPRWRHWRLVAAGGLTALILALVAWLALRTRSPTPVAAALSAARMPAVPPLAAAATGAPAVTATHRVAPPGGKTAVARPATGAQRPSPIPRHPPPRRLKGSTPSRASAKASSIGGGEVVDPWAK